MHPREHEGIRDAPCSSAPDRRMRPRRIIAPVQIREKHKLKDPSETLFVIVSVSSSSFARLPAQVKSFIQNLPPHNDQSNVRSQIRDMCNKFHREIMTTSFAAIQPVVSRQLCSMAEYMWNGFTKSRCSWHIYCCWYICVGGGPWCCWDICSNA